MIIQLFLFQVFTFAGIIFVLKFFYDRNMKVALKRLREISEESQLKESQLKEELDRAARGREAEVAKGKEEANRLIESAKKSADVLRRTIESDGQMEADRLKQEGEEGRIHLENMYREKAKTYAINLSHEVLYYILSLYMKEKLHHELIEEVISEIEAVDKNKFLVQSKVVKLSSSHPLDFSEKEKLTRILVEKLEHEITFEEQIDESILGGLLLEIGTFAVDGTLKNKLNKAFKLVEKDFV